MEVTRLRRVGHEVIVRLRDVPRSSRWGPVTRVTIERSDRKRMGWEAIWKAFTEVFPGRWAVEIYPPERCLVNEENQYHLALLAEEPPPEVRIDPYRYGLEERPPVAE